MQDNHEIIYEKLGKLETGINFLVDDAKKKNGYIADLNKRQYTTDNLILEFRNANEKVYDMLLEERKKRTDKYKFFVFIKENYILFLLTITTSGAIGTFIPLVWMWIKKVVRSG